MTDAATSNDSIVFENSEISWPRPLRFWLLLCFDIPAIVASLIGIIHVICTPTTRSALHNHTTLILFVLVLIFLFIDVSSYMDFLRHGTTRFQTPAYCLTWWLVDLGIYNTSNLIVAWMSIERHILVFHDAWISTQWKRFFIHYLPLITLLIYAVIYYAWIILYPPCQHDFVYILPVCSATPCHLLHPILGIWEMGIHGCLSTLIIAFFSISLLVRVIIRKYRSQRIFQWRKYRRMIIQLLSIAFLYLTFNLPTMALSMARLCGLSSDVAVQPHLTAFFLSYWVMLLFPIIALFSLVNVRKTMRRLIYPYSRNRIRPGATGINTITSKGRNRI